MNNEKVVDLFKLTGIDNFPNIFAAGLTEQVKEQLGLAGETPIEDEILAKQAEQAMTLVSTALDAKKRELFDEIVAVYSNTFTENEIEALLAFYSSDVGKKIVAAGGIVLPKLADIGGSWGAAAMKSIEGELYSILQQPSPQP